MIRSTFALFLTTSQDVTKATNELANKTSAGYDNISVNLIKKINVKKLWFIHELTAHYTSKTAKITKR